MAIGVPQTTQILFGLILTNPSREVQLFPGGGADGPKPTETNRTSVFRGGSGPSDPPPSGLARMLSVTYTCLECSSVCMAAINYSVTNRGISQIKLCNLLNKSGCFLFTFSAILIHYCSLGYSRYMYPPFLSSMTRRLLISSHF